MKSEERRCKFLVPENLDIPGLLKANEELVIKYEIEEIRVRWFCDLLLNQRVSQRKRMLDDETEFVNLSSVLMQQMFRNYNSYVEFLDQVGVIDVAHQFLPGSYCRGYKFTDQYSGTGIHTYEVEDRKMIRSIKGQERRFKARQKASLRGYKHLRVGFESGLLDIDLDGAKKWIDDYTDEALSNLKPKSKTYSKKRKIIFDTAHDFKVQVGKIKEQKYACMFRGNGNRFYSVISNLKRELRDFLTYDGKRLVEVDVKNCQPFLSLNLFRPDFWKKDLRNSDLLNFHKIDKNLYRERFEEKGLIHQISILVKSIETQYYQGSQLNVFREKILSGTFYEFIMEQFSSQWPKRFINRDKTKRAVLTMFFDDPAKEGIYYSPSHGFKKFFPEVYQLFRLIQSEEYEILAILLQRIESYLLLDKVTKFVSKEMGGIPMFPIHDSILTLEEHAVEAKDLMREQIKKYTGHEPVIAVKGMQIGTDEIWKSIPGYESEYLISALGIVKSLERMVNHRSSERFVKEHILSRRVDNNGYLTVRLSKNGEESTQFIHRLLATTYLSNILNHQVNHKNGIKSDNRLENLEWVTPSQNTIHAYQNDLIKIKTKKVVDICSGEVYESSLEASNKTGVNYNTLRSYLSGRKENPTCLEYEAA